MIELALKLSLKDQANMNQRRILIFWLSNLILLYPLWGEASEAPATIRSFIGQVCHINPGIQSAEADVSAAFANALALSRPLYNPELTIDAERIHNDAQEDTYSIGLSQTLDLFNKRGANHLLGKFTLEQAQAALAAEKLSTGIRALSALRAFNTSKQIVLLANRRTKLLEKFVKLTENKHAAGDLGQTELDQSKLALSESIAQLASTEVAFSQAKEALVAITNRISNDWPILPDYLPTPPQLPKDLTAQVQHLPTLQMLTFRVKSANAHIKIAKTNTRPDPTISLRGGQEDKDALIGFNFSIPLFVRNNFHDQVASANQEAIAIEKTRLNAYWQASAKLQGTVSRYSILNQAYKRWHAVSAGSLNNGIKLLDRLWDAGEINTTDYLIQLKQRIDSQIAGVELKNRAWEAWFQWLDASGNLDSWIGNDV